ncbi:hypothetical protein GCM10011610_56840 [Nocardia rhizosphaerihabitans]|uniref:DUF262 domain-containing protein n=1 Tax=Nocardia rhizosphaerihabitans TaxID=1691570 RepID=A0ABQ2KVK9_9NOCA|nr:hypothetical protein GCM10011610_56840 [Nocardia rhizosphaerihabitans]
MPGSVAGAISRYLVVDGQQRLTTLTLLLAAVRDHLRDSEGASRRDTDRIHHQWLTNQYEDDPYRLKLVPTQADRQSYSAVIDGAPTAGGDDPVGEAYRFFRARLAEPTDIDAPYGVSEILQAIVSGLSVVSISAHPGDNVHRIFQSLNNTGLRLTQGDLLRNYLFMRLPTRGEEVHRKYWAPLQESLANNERIETLFWLDLLHRRPQVKQSQTFAFQQARLDRLGTEDEIADEVERIARLGSLYRLMLNPELEPDQAVRMRLQRLTEWESTTPAPLVLHLLLLRDWGVATSEQIARALLSVESMLVRRFLVGHATQGLNRVFAAAVQELDTSLPADQALNLYLSAGRKHFATDAQLLDAVLTTQFYWVGRSAQRKVMMTWIERLYPTRESVSPVSLTIEHVMPQSLSPRWRTELAEQYGTDQVDELHERWLHTLGNLTLTGYNENLSNHEFARKRVTLRASSIRMNQEIATNEAWGPEQIEHRARALAKRIVEAWPGPEEGAHVAAEDNPLWSSMNRLLMVLPAGHWATYGDIARVLGTAAQPLGNRLATYPAPNAHRVLGAYGTISDRFRWTDPHRTDDPRQILEAEGIRFSASGKADPAQRLGIADLENLRADAEDDTEPQETRGESVPDER